MQVNKFVVALFLVLFTTAVHGNPQSHPVPVKMSVKYHNDFSLTIDCWQHPNGEVPSPLGTSSLNLYNKEGEEVEKDLSIERNFEFSFLASAGENYMLFLLTKSRLSSPNALENFLAELNGALGIPVPDFELAAPDHDSVLAFVKLDRDNPENITLKITSGKTTISPR